MYHISEETIFRKIVTRDGTIYKGKFHLTQFGPVILATNGNYMIPLSSVRHMVKELENEACNRRKPCLYKPEQDKSDS